MSEIPRIEIVADQFNPLPSWWGTSWIRLEVEVCGQHVRLFAVVKGTPAPYAWSGQPVVHEITDHRHGMRVTDLRAAGLIPQIQAA